MKNKTAVLFRSRILNSQSAKNHRFMPVNGFRFNLGNRFFVVMGGVLALVLSSVQVTLSAHIATTGREVRQLEERKVELYRDIGLLKRGVAELSRIDVIQARAETNLGLRKVNTDDVVYITDMVKELFAKR